MIQSLLWEDGEGGRPVTANVFLIPPCTCVLVWVSWGQAKTLCGRPVGEGAYVGFAKQLRVPTSWLEFLLTCPTCC